MVVGKERTCEISRSAYEAAVTYESEGERAIRLDFSRDSDDLDDDDDIITAASAAYIHTYERRKEQTNELASRSRIFPAKRR